MYICNCNGINETEVDEALAAGVRHWDEVHAHFDTEPCCGKCEFEISEKIEEHHKARLGGLRLVGAK